MAQPGQRFSLIQGAGQVSEEQCGSPPHRDPREVNYRNKGATGTGDQLESEVQDGAEAVAPGEEKPKRELGGMGDPERASIPRSLTMYSEMMKSGLNFYFNFS